MMTWARGIKENMERTAFPSSCLLSNTIFMFWIITHLEFQKMHKWEAFCYFWINGSRWPAAWSLQLSESHNQSDGVMQLKDALLRVNRTLSHFLRTTFWSPVKRHNALSPHHRQTINWPSTLADLVSVFGENIFVSSLAAIVDLKVSLLV